MLPAVHRTGRRSPAFIVAAIGALLATTVAADDLHPAVSVAPPGSWVQERALALDAESPADQVSNGTYYLLSDVQIDARGGDRSDFRRFARRFDSKAALADGASLDIVFNPAHQKLTLHHIRLHRPGAPAIDQLDPASLKIVHREEGHERQLYDGRLTAIAVLEDVRVGDTLDYAYTISGANPVFGGRFSSSFNTSWSSPLEAMNVRILWDSERPLQVRHHATDFELQQTEHPGHVEYHGSAKRVAAVLSDGDNPPGYNVWGWVQLTEYKSWAEVAAWAAEQYANDSPLPAETLEAIRPFRDLATPQEQAAAALHYVQDQIRYLGMFDGVHSHRPHAIESIAKRRFGDCKDKTTLLISMLTELGIDARPALVETDRRASIADWLPTPHAFDHVITQVRIDGTAYWVDPTRTFQRGPLAETYLPDYGLALVVDPATADLTEIPYDAAKASTIHISETYRFDEYGGGADYRVTTTYTGGAADYQRSWFASNSPAEVRKMFLDYYADDWPDIAATDPITTDDDPATNTFTVSETYRIGEAWQEDEDDPARILFGVYARAISDEFSEPDSPQRTAPFDVGRQRTVTQEIRLSFPTRLNLEGESYAVRGEAFSYTCDSVPDGDDFVVTHKLVPGTGIIPADRVPEYMDQIAEVEDLLADWVWVPKSYKDGLPVEAPLAASPEEFFPTPSFHLIAVALVALLSSTVLSVALAFWRPRPLRPPVVAEPAKLTGLGGWLVVVAVIICANTLLAPLAAIWPFVVYDAEAWAVATDPTAAGYHPNLAAAITVETVYAPVLFPLALLAVGTFFRRRTSFPHIFFTIGLFGFLTSLLEAFLWLKVPTPELNAGSDHAAGLFASFMFLFVWGTYVYKSKRVRLTFTRGYRGRTTPPA